MDTITGVFEVHIFCAPFNASDDIILKFRRDCEAVGMKGLYLFLDFDDTGYVGVLQSSKYRSGTMADARDECAQNSAHLKACGWEVLREKIEAVAANKNVPDTVEDAKAFNSYFESHISLARADGVPMTLAERAQTQDAAKRLAREFQQRIPTSYNGMKEGQCYINTRWTGTRTGFYDNVQKVEQRIIEVCVVLCCVVLHCIVLYCIVSYYL